MEETNLDLKEIAIILRRWGWWLVFGLLLGAGSGVFVSSRMNPVYQSTTSVLITRASQYQASDVTAYLSDVQLTQTYLKLLTTKTLLDITAERTGVPLEPEDLEVQAIRDTQIIEVRAEHTDPRRAALIANTLVDVLIEQNEVIQSGRYDSMEESLRAQKRQIETKIQTLQQEIDEASIKSLEEQKLWMESKISALEKEEASLQQEITELGTVKSPEERLLLDQKNTRLEETHALLSLYQENYNNLLLIYGSPEQSLGNTPNSQLSLLVSTRTLYQQFYATILRDLETVRLARLQNTPNIVQIEIASVPEEPIGPRLWLNTVLGGLLGIMFTLGIVYLREELDDTLKKPDAVEKLLGVPVIGFVPQMRSKRASARKVHVVHQPRSPVAEAFRSLRVNLDFASLQEPIHTLMVTSPGCAEGKSTVAVNLAAMLALSGKRVALVDADMRHPQAHHFFGIPNHDGLSSLFRNPALVHSAGRIQSNLPQLRIITSGDLPPNPAELLGSKKMDHILAELRKIADIVVIDTPPFLVADARVLASKVDAVLFVVWLGKTTAERAKASLELFKLAGTRVIGTVLNHIPRNLSFYYGGDEYHSHYSQPEGSFSGNGARPEKELMGEDEPGQTELSHKNLMLYRTATLYPEPEELSPPNPPKN